MGRLWGCGLLLVLAVPCAAAPSPKSELKDVRERIGALKKEMKSTAASHKEAADALRQSELAISHTNRKLRDLDQQEQSLQERLGDLHQQSGKTQGAIARQQKTLARLMRQQYTAGGRQDAFKILLNQQDPNQVARHLHYYTYVYRAHADLLLRMRSNLETLQTITDVAKEKQEELARVKAEQTEQKETLLASKQERAEVLTRLSKQIDTQRKEITRLQQDQQRLTQLMERLERQSRAAAKARKPPPKPRSAGKSTTVKLAEPDTSGSAFQQHKGKLPFPVRGELTGRFGAPRDETGVPWKGLFIKAREGEAIKAVAPGKVVFADWMRGFGNLIIVDHGAGFMSLYANAESLYKQEGEGVKMGESIASVGNSGGISQTGLYFELRYQSKPVNPSSWLGRG
jgi:septal ring factor EnvC (AmiA/AmiB activator)